MCQISINLRTLSRFSQRLSSTSLIIMMKGLAAVLILYFSVLSGCAPQVRLNSFFFIQMADTQFGFFEDNRSFGKETINFEKAIAAANRLKPQFVVVCGDLVNKPGYNEQVAEYRRIASKLNPAIRLYNVAGNHDVENIPTEASLKYYRENFGKDYYSFTTGNMVGIVLNSSMMRDGDSVKAEAVEQDRWLRAELEKARKTDKLIMVFQHHSLFLEHPDEKDGYFNFPQQKRKEYLELFHENNVKFIFAGHYHRNAKGRDGDLEMITTGPVGRPLGWDPSGFRIVTIDHDLVTHRYYGLDDLPGVVEVRD
jgi:serine/threonine-protein phosphatase CPPED1